MALLQKKLADETKSAEQSGQQLNPPNSGATSRVIAVEPTQSNTPAPANTAASGSSPPANTASPEDGTKVAAAESRGAEQTAPEAAKTTQAPLAKGAARQEIAQDMLIELTNLGCHFGGINGNWGARSRLALDRFNRLASLELPLDEPQQASLDALKAWKGPHCPVKQAVPPRIRQRPPTAVVVPKIQAPPPRRAARSAPPPGPSIEAGPLVPTAAAGEATETATHLPSTA